MVNPLIIEKFTRAINRGLEYVNTHSDEEVANYRKSSKKYMSVLLVKRDDYPFKGKWCLPGGFLDVKEDLEDCPRRILARETNLHDIYLEQLYTYGGVHRDPRMRIVSTSYMALVDKNRLTDKLSENASWFNITYFEEIKIQLNKFES